MLTIRYETRFRRDYKRILKRGYDKHLFEEVLEYLVNQLPLPQKYNDHALTGNWNGFRECHIQPDWLLIYHIEENELLLCFTRTGTHSDLYNK